MRNVVAGNWKSNKLLDEALNWMDEMNARCSSQHPVRVMAAVPAPFLTACVDRATSGIEILAQNVSANGMGAHTGEYTADMLKSCGVVGALVGHSERRARFGDSDAVVASKVDELLDADLVAVFCCGETLQEREGGRAEDVVLEQLQSGVLRLEPSVVDKIIVAYEPVWAIGTGVTATSEQAQEMHGAIRRWMSEAWEHEIANSVPILYGGSCKPSNARELFSQKDIDGGLIGGASLDPDDFQAVVAGHPAYEAVH